MNTTYNKHIQIQQGEREREFSTTLVTIREKKGNGPSQQRERERLSVGGWVGGSESWLIKEKKVLVQAQY